MPRKAANPNMAVVTRIIFMMFVWVVYILFTLACISYSPSDPPSQQVATFDAVKIHNWCGRAGAFLADKAMVGVGPGVFIAIVLLGIALVMWTKGDGITQLPLRVIGGAALVSVMSAFVNMINGQGPHDGGLLGIALGSLLAYYFKHGAWFIMLATFVVGALLVADEVVLALPAKLLWVRSVCLRSRWPAQRRARLAAYGADCVACLKRCTPARAAKTRAAAKKMRPMTPFPTIRRLAL